MISNVIGRVVGVEQRARAAVHSKLSGAWDRVPFGVRGRIAFGLIAVGMAGLVSGTLRKDSHPEWPSPAWWAILAGLAGLACLVAIVKFKPENEAVALTLSGFAIVSRGAGYLFAPSSSFGFNGAAFGAYSIGAGLVMVIVLRSDPKSIGRYRK